MNRTCHCGAPTRNDGGDYTNLCTQWPLCMAARPAPVAYCVNPPAGWDDPDAYSEMDPPATCPGCGVTEDRTCTQDCPTDYAREHEDCQPACDGCP